MHCKSHNVPNCWNGRRLAAAHSVWPSSSLWCIGIYIVHCFISPFLVYSSKWHEFFRQQSLGVKESKCCNKHNLSQPLGAPSYSVHHEAMKATNSFSVTPSSNNTSDSFSTVKIQDSIYPVNCTFHHKYNSNPCFPLSALPSTTPLHLSKNAKDHFSTQQQVSVPLGASKQVLLIKKNLDSAICKKKAFKWLGFSMFIYILVKNCRMLFSKIGWLADGKVISLYCCCCCCST